MAGPYRIEISRQQTVLNSGSGGYKLQITAQSPIGLSEKIFVYYRTTANNNIFEGVCSPAQLSLLPVTNPDPAYTPDPQRFRLATYDRTFETIDEADDAWKTIHEAVDLLLDRLDLIDKFTTSATFLIGTSSLTHTISVYIMPTGMNDLLHSTDVFLAAA